MRDFFKIFYHIFLIRFIFSVFCFCLTLRRNTDIKSVSSVAVNVSHCDTTEIGKDHRVSEMLVYAYLEEENNTSVEYAQVASCTRRYICVSEPCVFNTQPTEVEMPK